MIDKNQRKQFHISFISSLLAKTKKKTFLKPLASRKIQAEIIHQQEMKPVFCWMDISFYASQTAVTVLCWYMLKYLPQDVCTHRMRKPVKPHSLKLAGDLWGALSVLLREVKEIKTTAAAFTWRHFIERSFWMNAVCACKKWLCMYCAALTVRNDSDCGLWCLKRFPFKIHFAVERTKVALAFVFRFNIIDWWLSTQPNIWSFLWFRFLVH